MKELQPLWIVLVVMIGIYFIASLSYTNNSATRYEHKIAKLQKKIDCLKKEICKCDKK